MNKLLTGFILVPMQDHIRDWLHRRQITDAIIDDFGIHDMTHPTMDGATIVIPVLTESGNFAFNKYRRDPLSDDKPKYMYDKGGKSTLYAWSRAKNSDGPIVVTEGELDTLVLWSKNIPAVSSTGGAMTFMPEWGELLAGREVILCFDNDEAGGEGMVRALGVLPHAKVLFLPDRPGVKDISDYVQSGGDIRALLQKAKHFENVSDVTNHRSERLALWQSTFFHDAYIKVHVKPAYVKHDRKETSDKVLRAKQYPLEELLKINRDKCLCPFHNEKTPSCHYYRNSNKLYCFGACGKSYDAIDVYMKLYGCDFKNAVEKMQ